jgi:hypothetical protein
VSEFAEIDAAIKAGDRPAVVAAVLDWMINVFARQQVGILQQSGWNLAIRFAAKLRSSLLAAMKDRELVKR